MIKDLERDQAHQTATAEFVRRARAAMEKAAKLRGGGDETHARLADAVAREWAQAGGDLVRAVDAESKAAQARQGTLDAGATAERDRALLEEGIAHNGRLRAQLEAMERESKEVPARTSKVASTSGMDAGAPPAPKSPSRALDGGAR
jgi:hypothetical protein